MDTTARAGAIRVRNFTKAFAGRVVLEDVSFDIEPGEFVALLGRSGSGKSTLLRALSGLDPVEDPENIAIGDVAIAFQEPRLLPWLKVWRNVLIGVDGAGGPQVGGDGRQLALTLLQQVGLEQRAEAWPLTLSGGEAQRVSLARALVREPQVLLLDEPFGALDALTRISMHRLVKKLREAHGQTILLVTHDVDEAIVLADRTLVLAEGRIAAEHRVERPSDPAAAAATHERLKRSLLRDLGVEASDKGD